MNENAPTLPGQMPVTPPIQNPAATTPMGQPAVQPAAAPAAQQNTYGLDFSEGDKQQVMQGSGNYFQSGSYWWVLTKALIKTSQNPQSRGQKVAIFEGIVVKNLQADGSGTPVGASASIVVKESNSYAFYPTIRKVIACLQRLTDPNQTRTAHITDILNNPSLYYGVALPVRVADRTSKENRPYQVQDFEPYIDQMEFEQYLATQPELCAVVIPQGSRTQNGLAGPETMFTQLA